MHTQFTIMDNAELDALQDEYAQAKEKFEQLRARVQEEADRTEALLQEREIAYNSFIDMSLNRHSKGALPAFFVPTPAVPAAAAAVAETLSTSVSSSPLSEGGKDSKQTTTTGGLPGSAATAAAGGAGGGRAPPSPSKRSFFSFFMPSSSSSSAAPAKAK